MVKLKNGIAGLGGALRTINQAASGGGLVVTADGTQTTVIAGKSGAFMIVPQNITVDVNMDETKIAAPTVNVKVVLDGEELRGMIDEMIVEQR